MIKLTAGTSSIILPLHDTNGELQEWIDKHYATELMRIMAPPSVSITARGQYLVFPNYSGTPQICINQMVVPTGASRWGYGLFLATEAQKDAIYEAQSRNGGTMVLQMGAPVIGDQVGEADSEALRTISIAVHCLPPKAVTPRGQITGGLVPYTGGVSRRIEATSGYPTASDLFLIPVVDTRWLLQSANTGELSSLEWSTPQLLWAYLQNRIPRAVAGGLSATVQCDDIHPAYTGAARPRFLTFCDQENLAAVIDAFCWMFGLCFVPDVTYGSGFTGVFPYRIVSVRESSYIFGGFTGSINRGNINGWAGLGSVPSVVSPTIWNGGYQFVGVPLQIAGGDSWRLLPESYTRSWEGDPFPSATEIKTGWTTWDSRSPPSSLLGSSQVVDSTVAVIRYEWHTSQLPSTVVSQINADYYHRFQYQYDYNFIGIQRWQMSCFDDFSVYSMTQAGGEYRCHTRVVSLPLNTQADMPNTNQDRLRVKLKEDLYAANNSDNDPSTAKAWVRMRKSNGNLIVTNKEITVTNRYKNISVDKGTYVKVELMEGDEWEPYASDCPGDLSESVGSSDSDGMRDPLSPSEGF